jgi:hypothetical protein
VGGIREAGKKDTLCVVDPQGEICDGNDNDCDGKIDNVDPSKLATDVKNCGSCGNACSFANAFAKCVDSKCVFDGCAPGYWDVNKDTKDGCEYQCLQTNGGVEICDNVDNDCDNTVDNGFDKQTDSNNCGSCGTVCPSIHTTSTCVAGKCQISACEDGYKDVNGDPLDGCEYTCPVWPPSTSDGCDGIDNNCNGKIDEDFTSSACGKTVGECVAGTKACVGGLEICQGEVAATPEVCDGKDNDCDGTTDNGYDKQSDPRYCGDCTPCVLSHAVAKCTAGVCAIAVCETGQVDLDKDPTTGCEYKCTITGPEICDGIDNDCNGKIDTADPGMMPLTINPCASVGACAGATASCKGTEGWVCSYGADVQLLPCSLPTDCGGAACVGGFCVGVVASDESRCDGKDNDCDGKTDEPYTNKDQPCAEAGKKGICQGTGKYVCNAAGTAVECSITSTGKTAKDEECNGLDDDCDGLTDEGTDDTAGMGVHDAMVHVARTVSGTAYDYYIYSYEASRPDASSTNSGKVGTRSCSKAGVIPWSSVTYAEASTACAASGKRLCSKNEWVIACQGTAGNAYPYGATYNKTACNGYDSAVNAPVATGMATCVGGESGLYDMSGNLREWTSEQAVITPTPPVPLYVVRGGAFHTPEVGLMCTFDLSLAVADVPLPANGFRCCSNTPP